MKKPKDCCVSVVIPVYGSQSVLRELVLQLNDAITLSFELILVCDKSPDGSWEVIKALSEEYSNITGVLLRLNSGQHNALMAGFSLCRGDYVITIDDDLQHSPFDIPRLISEIDRGYDVVYARFRNREHALWKKAGSYINDIVAGYLLKKPKGLYLSPFRAIRADLLKEIIRYKGPYVYIDGLILTVTENISTIDVDHHSRFSGKSGYGFHKSLSLWVKMATSFSIFPLRLTTLLGLFFSLIGFVFALLLIIQKLSLNIMPNGWSSLIVTILIMGGVQLLALGMIGEYLGRTLLTLNNRPQYIIQEMLEYDKK